MFRKIFDFAKHESNREFIFDLSIFEFLLLHMLLNYKLLKHALCDLIKCYYVLLISQNYRKTLASYIAARCKIEFCSVGFLKQSIRRRFEEPLF